MVLVVLFQSKSRKLLVFGFFHFQMVPISTHYRNLKASFY
jgi:hypothetical protein